METLGDLLRCFGGQPIPHCPGRYVLRGVAPAQKPTALISSHRGVTEHVVARARDRVVVTRLGESGEWGLISYARPDGTWLHTANTAEGFARKLADLGVALPTLHQSLPSGER